MSEYYLQYAAARSEGWWKAQLVRLDFWCAFGGACNVHTYFKVADHILKMLAALKMWLG